MKFNKKSMGKYLIFISVAILFFGSASRVDATAILTIDDGTNPIVTVLDNGAGDGNAVTGNVSSGSTVGATNPAIGSAGIPEIALNDNVMRFVAGTTEIAFNVTDYSATNILGFETEVGGTITSFAPSLTARFDFYFDANNDMDWSDATLMSSLTAVPGSGGNFSTGLFVDIGSLTQPLPAKYALTIVANITSADGFTMTGFGAKARAVPDPNFTRAAAVPEPATIVLLGIGLAGLCGGGYMRMRRRINKD